MSAVPTTPRVKLRTTSRRVPRVRANTAVDDSPEPTMRLSRAIMVMLLLHVVAVGGFFASSVLKEKDLQRTSSSAVAPVEAEDSQIPAKGGSANAVKRTQPASSNRPSTHVVRPGETLTLIANENGVTLEALVAANGADTVTNGLRAGQELKLPEKSPEPSIAAADSTSTALKLIEGHLKPGAMPGASSASIGTNASRLGPDSGKMYVVAKGDNALTISQKNKVGYDALLKLNQIDDPKKIHPGQKLRLPPVNKAKPNQG